ncbi:hypothetical protein SUGI_0134000 [Cryptomeria japonica]|nr:hypothetical protein SUGI_0134000 [Cryptomeria japonica]
MDVSNVLNGVLNTVADESIKKPYREVKNLRSLRSNAACLREVIDRVKGIGDDIKTLLSGPGRQPKRVVRNWLNTQKRIVKSAEEVLQQHLKTKDSDFPTNGELGELPGALVQPVENELVGKFVHEKLQKLETWLLKDDSVRVVGVYGMPGVGKTSLLKHINNNEKGTFPAGEDQNMDSEIEPLVRSIAKECKGHPLAIKTLARTVPDLQNSTPSEWSYDALESDELRLCFVYLAAYREDEEIDADELIQLWLAEGLVKRREEGRHGFLGTLANRCLVEIEVTEANGHQI